MTESFLIRTTRSPLSALAAMLALTSPAWATQISNQPLASLPNITASPNLQIVMDTSGSMANAYMPDDVNNLSGSGNGTSSYGYYSSQCNGVAYDPTHAYTPPQKYDGSYYGNASFSGAWDDGYAQANTTGLSGKSFFIYSNSSTTTTATTAGGTSKRLAMDWTYNPSVVTTTDFYRQCASKVGNTPGSSVFTKVLASSLTAGAAPSATDYHNNLAAAKTTLTTTAQQTNYANWYSYYSKRFLLMRTAMGQSIQAFNPNAASSTPGYRVGFNTIYYGISSECTSCQGTKAFVDLADFDATQMSTLYDKLYSVAPSGGTNLPDALAEAGHYFAHKTKLDGTSPDTDPMQYACQRNYALLTTDGYWNINNKDYKLDGSTRVGNQDSSEVKPMWDGTHVTVTTTTIWTAPATRTQIQTQTATTQWTLAGKKTSSTKFGGNGTNKNNYAVSSTTQTYNQTFTRVTSTPQTATASQTETQIVTDGVVTSDTKGTVSYSTWQSGTPTTTTTDTGAPPTPAANTWSNWGTAANGTTTFSTSAGNGQWTYSQSSGTQSSWSSATTTYNPTTGGTTGTFVAGTPSSNSVTSGGTSDTLADVAEYYYKTDLRDTSLGNCGGAVSSNVCLDIVPTTSNDTEKFQHMNTFTIGLGVSGTLPNTSATLAGLTDGSITWPVPTAPSGAPNGSGGDATNVDDLWHAALNGRGQFFSALNADQLSTAISSVIDSIAAVKGAGSGSSTSSLALVAGDNNQIYTASYTTSDWTGDVVAQTLNGDGSIKSQVWSAADQLDAVAKTDYTARQIYFNSGGTLTAFTYGKLTTTVKGYFDNFCSKSVIPSQCTTLASTAADLTAANNGTNLVNFLRGDRTYEAAGAALSSGTTKNALYRARKHVLGDIIDGAPIYVGKPPFSYADAGYAAFVSSNASRTPVIYTAANDGMLHAISASTSSSGGSELWAFVPTPMMPYLYQLANSNYSVSHRFFVDGAPVEGDAYLAGAWKTILVGGFNSGGQGYYALDITDPLHPKMLWEFSDANMGLSYGNPIITKNAAGTWVVVFTSGYNNTGGDGNGHLYVVDAATGAKLKDISTYTSGTTAAGSSSAPSGLAQINAWIDVATNNTSLRFYGGDELGNVWRFDTDGLVTPKNAALLLATLQVSGTPQPITTRPETVSIKSRPAVVVATGRYLNSSDIADKTQQSLYVITDNLDTVAGWSGWGNPRTNTTAFAKASVTVNGTTGSVTATGSTPTINFADTSFGGWYMDQPHSGERVFTNMVLSGTVLTMTTAVPSGDACTSGGSSWVYFVDLGSVTGTTLEVSDQALVVGVGQITDASGNVKDIFNFSNGDVKLGAPPTPPVTSSSILTRASWRELVN